MHILLIIKFQNLLETYLEPYQTSALKLFCGISYSYRIKKSSSKHVWYPELVIVYQSKKAPTSIFDMRN